MRFAICTSVYEAGRPFLENWIAGALAAADGHETEAIFAVDGLDAPETALARLAKAMPVAFADAPNGATIAEVRAIMLRRALESDADVLVFCDMDDRLRADALGCHAEALENADFSYGDLQPISCDGETLGGGFLDGTAVPDRITRTESIIDRNWLGLSNTAVWRSAVPETACDVPSGLIAVDWWLFTTLLKSGLKGARANGVVADYRTHDANQLGARPAPTIEATRHRLDIMKRHYQTFPADVIAGQRLARVNWLIERLDKAPDGMRGAIEAACAEARLWYEDIAQLDTGPETGTVTAVQLPDYTEPGTFTTHTELASALREIGVEDGDTLMVHISTKSMGLVIGGLRTVLDALYDAIGGGTLMMPSFTGDLTDPATWFKPPVAEYHWQTIRDAMPAFDPDRTPAKDIGALAELFRNEPGTRRSSHPVSSFAARGPNAAPLLMTHDLDSRFGTASPLQAFCDLGGKVALIGAPFESMTLLHLSSYKLDDGVLVDQCSPVLVNGQKEWVAYQDRSLSWQWFAGAVENLIEKKIARLGTICGARSLIVDAAEAVAETCAWRKRNNC